MALSKKYNIPVYTYSKNCPICHALGENFYVGIDRVSDYTVENTKENDQIRMKINVG